jgi:hypothetical protein
MKQKRSEFSRKFREIILEFLPGRTSMASGTRPRRKRSSSRR